MKSTHRAPSSLAEGNPVVAALGSSGARVLGARPLGHAGAAFFEVACGRNRGLTDSVCEDAFVLSLQMQASRDFRLYADGRPIESQPFDAGSVAIFDLRSNLASDMRDPIHVVDFYLPRRALDAAADDAGMPRIEELAHRPGTAQDDPVARALLLSVRPALAARPEEVSALFIDHVATALTVHAAHRYGGMRLLRPTPRGGLAPWQERRAKDLLSAGLTGGVSLDRLANECKLSVRHFTRAFRQSTGMSAHEWLLHHRLEKAKGLLTGSLQSLAGIAAECGFADQSHFARSFGRAVGMSPLQWRRLHRGPMPDVSATVAPAR